MDLKNYYEQSVAEHHSYSVHMCKKYGWPAALLFENIYYWVKRNYYDGKNFYDGRYWTYNSRENFGDYFQELSSKQIRSAFDTLKKEGLIMTGNFNQAKFDKTLWYTITDKGFAEYEGTYKEEPQNATKSSNFENSEHASSETDNFDVPYRADASSETDNFDVPHRADASSETDNIDVPYRADRCAPQGNTNTKVIPSKYYTNYLSNKDITRASSAEKKEEAPVRFIKTIENLIGRKTRYEEKSIVNRWYSSKRYDLKVIELAIIDNLFRGDKFHLKYVEDELSLWSYNGINDEIAARNWIVDNAYYNAEARARDSLERKKDFFTEEELDGLICCSDIYIVYHTRNDILKKYRANDIRGISRIVEVLLRSSNARLFPDVQNCFQHELYDICDKICKEVNEKISKVG